MEVTIVISSNKSAAVLSETAKAVVWDALVDYIGRYGVGAPKDDSEIAAAQEVLALLDGQE